MGVPRSGTTWIAGALGRASGAPYVHEPDNHRHILYALRAKQGLGPFPALEPGDSAPRYERLWDAAFRCGVGRMWPPFGGVAVRPIGVGRRQRAADALASTVPSEECDAVASGGGPLRLRAAARLAERPTLPRRPSPIVIVKSVHAALVLEWLADRFEPQVVVVQRHPLNLVASWMDMGFDELGALPDEVIRKHAERWGVEPLPRSAPRLSRVAWRVAFYWLALEEAVGRRPEFVRVSHEETCADPIAELRGLAARLDLGWNELAEDWVFHSNRPGAGYDLNRLKTEPPARWRSKLSDSELDEVRAVLRTFPLVDELPLPGADDAAPHRLT